MNLEERLKYCKLCKNQSFDIDKGLLCNLTNEKAQFDQNCPDYSENPYERRNYETNLFSDKIKPLGLTETNIYPTSNWLISLAQKYIPEQFSIKRFELGQFVITPLILFSIPIFLANLNFVLIYRIPLIFGFVVLGILVSVKNWKSLKKESDELATLNRNGIKIGEQDTVHWSDVTLAYIKVDFQKQYLMFELLSRSEPIKLLINKSIGAKVILTVAEAYRRKEKNSNKYYE